MIAQRHTLANTLRVAAAQYNSDAHDASCRPGQDRLRIQLEHQAQEAFDLADAIENADAIRLED